LIYNINTNQIQGLVQTDDGNITFGTFTEGSYNSYGALILDFQYVPYTNAVVGPLLYFILQNATDFTQYLFTLILATGTVTSIPLNFMGNMISLGGLVWCENNNLFYAIGISHVAQPVDLVSVDPKTGDVTPQNLLNGYYFFLGAYTQDTTTNTYYTSVTSSLLDTANLTSIILSTKPVLEAEVPLQYAPIGALALP